MARGRHAGLVARFRLTPLGAGPSVLPMDTSTATAPNTLEATAARLVAAWAARPRTALRIGYVA